MNKVFKIVWSQALKTWVVASELTKSKSKSKSTVDAKTAWVVVSALATLSGATYAASGINGGTTSGGSNGTAISACTGGSQAQAIGSHAIAIGCDSVANNNDGNSGDTNIQLVNRKNPGNPHTGTQYLMQNAASTAIGYRAKADNASIALGDKAQAKNVGIAIGLGAESLANSAIALGSMAQAKGNTAFALGRQSVAEGHYATAIGNVAYAKSDSSIAMGHSATADGYRAIAIGGADSKKAPSDGVSDGAGYQASTQTLAKGEQAIAVGSGASATQNNALALGSGAVANLVGGVAIGQDSQTTASNKQAYLTGASAPKAVVSIGAKGSERRMQHVSAGAEDTDAVNVSQLKAVHTLAEKGWQISAQGANTSTVAPGSAVDFSNTDGNLKVAKGATNQKLTIDMNKDIKLDSLTINNGGPVLNKTGINLNNQKITNVKEGTNEGDAVNVFQLDKSIKNLNIELTGKGLNFLTNDGTLIHRDLGTTLVVKGDAVTDGTYSGNNIKTIAGKEGALAVQIADAPKFGEIVINDEGRISGLKAGVAGTDAVNVDQLKEAAGKGWNVTAQGKDISLVAPESTVDFGNADGNILVTKEGNNLKFDLAKDLTGDSLTINNGGPVINRTGINLNNTKIVNLTEGTNEGDAVNVKQLNKQITNVTNNLTAKGLDFAANEGSPIHRDLGTTLAIKGAATTAGEYSGHNLKTVANADGSMALQMAESPKFGNVTINDAGRITGLEKGVADTDAVNVSQLKDASGKGWNVTAQGKDISLVAPESTVDFGNADGNILVTKEGNNLKFDLAKDLTGDSLTINNGGPVINRTGINLNNTKIVNLTEGTNEGDAVNVKQLNQQITNVTNNLTAKGLDFAANEGSTIHRDLGTTLAIKGAATTAGEYSGHNLKTVANADGSMALQMAESPKFGNVTINDAGRITGLEKGVADTDAVNVSQLKDASGKGWNVTAQGKDISLVAPESTVDFGNADGNILVTKEGNNLKFDLAKDLTGDSLTINNGGPVLSKTGLNLNQTKITNLQAGSEDTDGVNVKQLKDLKAEGLNFAANEGSPIHRDLGATLAIKGAATTAGEYSGHNLKTVANADGSMALQMAESPKFGNVTINDAGRITGLEKGVEATDAVNVSQLANAVGELGWTLTDEEDKKAKIGDKATIALKGDQNVSVRQTGEDQAGQISVALNKALTLESITGIDNKALNVLSGLNVAGGFSVAKNSVINMGGNVVNNIGQGVAGTDAVNVDQLKNEISKVKWYVDGKGGEIEVTPGTGNGSGGVNPGPGEGGSQPGKPGGNTVTMNGADNIDVNVNGETNTVTVGTAGKGSITAGSKDVITGGQVHDFAESVRQIVGGLQTTFTTRDGSVKHVAEFEMAGGTQTTINDAMKAIDNSAVHYDKKADGSIDKTKVTLGEKGTPVTVGNVAEGKEDTDAVNVKQLKGVESKVLNFDNSIKNLSKSVNHLSQKIDDIDKDSRAGVAAAMAAAGLPQAYLPGKSMMAIAGSTWRGETGYAIGVSTISDNGNWVVKANMSGNARSQYGASAGVGYQW